MLDGSLVHSDEANIGNVENNNPVTVKSSNDGVNTGNKTRQALMKKGGRKLRSAAQLQQQKPPRNSPVIRLSDHNNNTLTAAAQPGTEQHPAVSPAALSLHHVRQGARKEMLKSKGGRLERGTVQPGSQSGRSLPRLDHVSQNVNTRSHKPKQNQTPGVSHTPQKRDNSCPNKSPSRHQAPMQQQKKPLHTSNNLKILNSPPANTSPEYLKDGEKVYAGAKFSEPPSPSVLPKPPSHWVGEKELQKSNQSREQMTVHLKSLLKVQDAS